MLVNKPLFQLRLIMLEMRTGGLSVLQYEHARLQVQSLVDLAAARDTRMCRKASSEWRESFKMSQRTICILIAMRLFCIMLGKIPLHFGSHKITDIWVNSFLSFEIYVQERATHWRLKRKDNNLPIKWKAADERPTCVANHPQPARKPVILDSKIAATPLSVPPNSPDTFMACRHDAKVRRRESAIPKTIACMEFLLTPTTFYQCYIYFS